MGISAYAVTRMADGTDKRVEDLSVGDIVRNAMSGGGVAVSKHWQGPAVGMFRIAADNDIMLDLTADQKVLTAQGMLPAGEIKPGMVLQRIDGQNTCNEASPLMGDFMVYDIALERDNASGTLTLSANGFIVGDMYA
jgi:hypothetical protein